MKKFFLFLSVILISVVLFSCKSECKKNEGIIGKWERTVVDSVSTTYILEITENYEWKYFKDGELLEEGLFAVEENIFIMKHKEEEHANADNHKYEYSLNEEKTELSFISEEKTSVFTRIK